MTFTRRIKLLFRIFRVIPQLDALDRTLPTFESLKEALPKIEAIQAFLPKLEALDQIFVKLEDVNTSLHKLEHVAHEKPHANGNSVHPIPLETAHIQEWNRLKMLSKFVQLAGRAKEIETEWQRIQQNEHDALYAFQTTLKEESEMQYLYKKGIADGIKWCVNTFS